MLACTTRRPAALAAAPRAPLLPVGSLSQRCAPLTQVVPRACIRKRRSERCVLPPLAAAVPSDALKSVAPAEEAAGRPKKGLGAMLAPFSNPQANARLLALCTAQMLGSVATLMHETYLPVYLSDVLHLSNTKIGNLQGTAQLLAKASGSISGTLADVISPARMVVLGAALTAVNKPMYASCGAVAAVAGTTACLHWVAFAKIFDRVAKGIREAPSKALIGELAAASGDSPAAAFGLRQSMATLGAMLGAAVASLAMHLTRRNYPLTFALSTVPAVLALLLLASAFGGSGAAGPAPAAQALSGNGAGPEDAASADGEAGLPDKARALLGALGPAYWQALAVVALLYMARFDAAFATLRARTVMDPAALPALLPLIMVTQGLLAAPMGLRAKAGARDRNAVLLAGMGAMIAADLCFAFLPTVAGVVLGAVLLGVHMGMTHGVSIGLLSSCIPAHAVPALGRVSGTAWSLTDLLLGVVLACSNWVAGSLSDLTVARGWGNIGCFLGGAVACALSMAALALFSWRGELGRDDLLPAAAGPFKPAAA